MARTVPRLFMIFAVIFVLLEGGVACSKEDPAAKAARQPVAKVNGTVITQGELDREISHNLPNTQQHQANGAQWKAMERFFLNRLVDKTLLLQQAERNKVTVSDQDVDKRWNDLVKGFPSQEVLNNFLKGKKITEKQVKADIRDSMRIEALLHKEVISHVSVTDQEVREEFDRHREKYRTPEEIRARHILFRVKADATPAEVAAVRRKAAAVLARIRKGEDFAKLAKEFSEDGSKVNGGELGYFKRGDMVPAFEKAAFALKVGQVSGLVRSRFGYHIIQVEDRKPARELKFDEVKNHIRENLTRQKANQLFQTYLQGLQKTAKIEILLPK